MAPVDISDDLLERLGSLRLDTVNASALVEAAIEDYLAIQTWQLEDIRRGIADADSGRFVPMDQVQALARGLKV